MTDAGHEDEQSPEYVETQRPEPPRFDELVRRPALFVHEPSREQGAITRKLGSDRLRMTFRATVLAVLIVLVLVAVL